MRAYNSAVRINPLNTATPSLTGFAGSPAGISSEATIGFVSSLFMLLLSAARPLERSAQRSKESLGGIGSNFAAPERQVQNHCAARLEAVWQSMRTFWPLLRLLLLLGDRSNSYAIRVTSGRLACRPLKPREQTYQICGRTASDLHCLQGSCARFGKTNNGRAVAKCNHLRIAAISRRCGDNQEHGTLFLSCYTDQTGTLRLVHLRAHSTLLPEQPGGIGARHARTSNRRWRQRLPCGGDRRGPPSHQGFPSRQPVRERGTSRPSHPTTRLRASTADCQAAARLPARPEIPSYPCTIL